MKNCIFLLLLACLTFACNAPAPSDQQETKTTETSNSTQVNESTIQMIDPGDLAQLMHGNEGFQLIDVRTPVEVAQGMIEGAQNIDFKAPDFKDKMLALDKSAPILVYCKSGGRSGKTASMLVEQGFTKVFDLDGGYTAYLAGANEN
ncbi:MAG: rhodanese-like domain-containing protein [Bacteroidota bacterium]